MDEQKDRKQNPYYQPDSEMAEDDYSEESDADSVYEEDGKAFNGS